MRHERQLNYLYKHGKNPATAKWCYLKNNHFVPHMDIHQYYSETTGWYLDMLIHLSIINLTRITGDNLVDASSIPPFFNPLYSPVLQVPVSNLFTHGNAAQFTII